MVVESLAFPLALLAYQAEKATHGVRNLSLRGGELSSAVALLSHAIAQCRVDLACCGNCCWYDEV
jgi:hypothetical protein